MFLRNSRRDDKYRSHRIWTRKNGQRSVIFSHVSWQPWVSRHTSHHSFVQSEGTLWWWSRMRSTWSGICSTKFCQMFAMCKALDYYKCMPSDLKQRLPTDWKCPESSPKNMSSLNLHPFSLLFSLKMILTF